MTVTDEAKTTGFAHLPHNQAAENNKRAIAQVWETLGLGQKRVFEIGSGTGQHGIFFCQQFPALSWQASEQAANLPLLTAWYEAAQSLEIANFAAPLLFDVSKPTWPTEAFDTVYCANVLHILERSLARRMIEQVTSHLESNQLFVCYGPFKREGEFTTASNRDFDAWLQAQGYGGLLDMAEIESDSGHQLKLKHCLDMPANNFLLVFTKVQ